jgi:kynureninase
MSQEANFPTDLYVAQGLSEMLGLDLRAVPAVEVLRTIGADTAVVTLTHVDYRSGSVHDMRAINEAAHAAGALVVWDLSHSAGAIEVDLDGKFVTTIDPDESDISAVAKLRTLVG